MKNSYHPRRNYTYAALTALLLLLSVLYQSSAQGQGQRARRKATAKKSSASATATPTPTPPQSTKTAPATIPAETKEGKLVPDEAKPGTVMSNQLGMDFVYVPAGSFMMGSDKGSTDERPAHRVTIGKGFYIGRYEITQAQWQVVMGANPSNFKGEDLPVEQISWADAQAFITKLNERNDPFIYRLPTEAEWEYACHAQMGAEGMGKLEEIAWYFNNSAGKTHPIGEKKPNAWGLYDTLGNVWEWCEDTYHDTYKGAPTDGSAWVKGGDAKYKVLRGGSWIDNAFYCRTNERIRATPDTRQRNSGLRLVAVARATNTINEKGISQ